jgi:hypothetical protein
MILDGRIANTTRLALQPVRQGLGLHRSSGAFSTASILARAVERKQAGRAAMFIAPSHQNSLKLRRSAMPHPAPMGLGSVFRGEAIHIPLLAELDYGGLCTANVSLEIPIMPAQLHTQSSGAFATVSTSAGTVEKRRRAAALQDTPAPFLPPSTSKAFLQRRDAEDAKVRRVIFSLRSLCGLCASALNSRLYSPVSLADSSFP